MEIKEFYPRSLTEGRIARGMNKADLAAALGLSRQAVTIFEQGFKRPSFETLNKICEVLQLPANFFTRPQPPPPEKATAIFYRKLRSTVKTEREKANVRTAWGWCAFDLLKKYIDPPSPNLPENYSFLEYKKFSDDDIEEMAEGVRKYWGLGKGPISNITLLLEKNGVIVIQLKMPEEINGFSYWTSEGTPIIACSDQVSAARHRFNIAHELGHLLLHKGIQQEEHDLNEDLIEEQAHRFAGAFLFPRNSFCEEFYSTNPNLLLGIKKRWNVAIQFLIKRASDLGIISKEELAGIYRRMGGKRKLEPLDDVVEIERPIVFIRAIKAILEANLLTKDDVKRALNYNDFDLAEIFGTPQEFFADSKNQDHLSPNVIKFRPRQDS